jgi:glycine dehydrogenase subunit 1
MPFIPHTSNDIKTMLEVIGESSIDALFDEIPTSLRCEPFQGIPSQSNEMQMLKIAKALSECNQNGICFLGAGSYEHHIPAAVWDIASRGEYLTAYTPYQAEASQGTLQLLYEYQSMMASLTGMAVSNASMYDGATALAEACLMAVRVQKKPHQNQILMPQSLHPLYQATLKTILSNQAIELIEIPYDIKTGATDLKALNEIDTQAITGLIIPNPNFFGVLEPVDDLCAYAKQHQLIRIACVNPMTLGLLKPPGEWGEDGVEIVCGEGQPLGAPMASGGPYFGFLTTQLAYVRQMPGRIVGKTIDLEGKEGFTLTLQAREQHIRRAKATSNICTNQGLLVTAATLHMSLLGPKGLEQVARACVANTHQLVDKLCEIPNVSRVFEGAYFHECLIKIPALAKTTLEKLAQKGILGGLDGAHIDPSLKNTILVCATEMRTQEEIERYETALREIL